MQANMIDHEALIRDLNGVWTEGVDDAREPIHLLPKIPDSLLEINRRRQGTFHVEADTVSHCIEHPTDHLNQTVVFPVYYRNDTNFTNCPCTVTLQDREDGDVWVSITFMDPDEKTVHMLYGHKPILITAR